MIKTHSMPLPLGAAPAHPPCQPFNLQRPCAVSSFTHYFSTHGMVDMAAIGPNQFLQRKLQPVVGAREDDRTIRNSLSKQAVSMSECDRSLRRPLALCGGKTCVAAAHPDIALFAVPTRHEHSFHRLGTHRGCPAFRHLHPSSKKYSLIAA